MNPNRLHHLITTALLLAAAPLHASSGDPVLEAAPQSLDSGGRRVTSANFTIDATLGGVLGVGTAAAPVAMHNRQGYIAQLFEVQTLAVNGPLTVAEGATGNFTTTALLDDGTTLAPALVSWSFTGAGQTISSTGEFFPAAVYLNSPARVNAAWRGVTGGADLTVLDVLKDNFGTYAGDGLRDLWQVQYFGEDSPLAAPGLAPYGDGIVNQLKHAWNVPPDDRLNSPTYALSGSYLTLTFRRLKVSVVPRPGYQVQVSSDLGTWLDNTSPGGPYTTETAVVSLNAETERVTVRDNTPFFSIPRRFIRLRVAGP